MDYSIGLALMDFVPNIAFVIGALFLVKIMVLGRGRPCSRMVMAGALLIALGGFLKATWKLLYAAEIGDFQLLSQIQFTLLAPGFLALVIAIIMLLKKRGAGSVPLAAMAAWKIPFLFVMTLSSLGCHGLLTFVSFKRGARIAAVCFIIAFIGLLSMSMLSSAEQTVTMQWVEESINSVGQIGFMMGSIFLHKNFAVKGC